MFGFVMANCTQSYVFGSNVLTAQLTDTASETRSKLHLYYKYNCYNYVIKNGLKICTTCIMCLVL
jgi:hypothetical protein